MGGEQKSCQGVSPQPRRGTAGEWPAIARGENTEPLVVYSHLSYGPMSSPHTLMHQGELHLYALRGAKCECGFCAVNDGRARTRARTRLLGTRGRGESIWGGRWRHTLPGHVDGYAEVEKAISNLVTGINNFAATTPGVCFLQRQAHH